jgi:hypothetical protein
MQESFLFLFFYFRLRLAKPARAISNSENLTGLIRVRLMGLLCKLISVFRCPLGQSAMKALSRELVSTYPLSKKEFTASWTSPIGQPKARNNKCNHPDYGNNIK